MDYSIKHIKENEKGFTLVELAVVMIIIGLLIGGILKGQELITNARVTSTIGQMEGLSAAYNDFRNQFNAMPGDMSTAALRVANCANVDACDDGDGDGIIGLDVGEAGGNDEGTFFFGQLLAAGYITGMDGTDDGAAASFGVTMPASSVEGGFLIGDTRTGVTGFAAGEFRPGVYLVHNGSVTDVGNSTGSLTGQQAASIDRRLDDGIASTGSIIGDNGDCDDGAAPRSYEQADQSVGCAIAYRL